MKAQACERLADYELKAGQLEAGRRHLWHSARTSRLANDGGEFKRKLAMLAGTGSMR